MKKAPLNARFKPLWLLLATALSGCVTSESLVPMAVKIVPPESAAANQTAADQTRVTGLYQTPPPPPGGRTRAGSNEAARAAPANENADTSLMFDQVPLASFIQTVYGAILKRNVSIDPQVQNRQDLVTLRTGTPQTPTQIEEVSRKLLKSYGIAVSDYGGMIRVTPDNAQAGYLPEILRGRALPEVPMSLRPVFQLVELQAVNPGNVSNWLKTMFGNKVQVQDDMARQAIMLSGQRDDVQAAMEAIQVLDQPAMRGRNSARIAPAFWSAEEMSKRLVDLLTAEGYGVSLQPNAQTPVILVPVAPLNSVIVFAPSGPVLDHVLQWARELDQPGKGGGNAGYFTYQVRNTDAAALAKTLQEIMSPGAAAPAAAPAAGATTAGGSVRSRVVVDAASNSLIIQGTSAEYQQWLGLLQGLDRPAKSALISVTVAEVYLTDSEQLGIEWLLHNFQINGYTVSGVGTLGNLGVRAIGGLGISGQGITINGGVDASGLPINPRVVINALATTSKLRVLSNPSIVTRNGETATIQVGDEVPIQTSTSTSTSTEGAPVIATIQYKQTGVILKVRPVIHSSGRLELDVSQEVSSASQTRTGVSSSPTITTKKIDTKLSMSDGNTILLGGIMSQETTRADTGIPLLKDIPIAGFLFKSNTDSVTRRELIIMITPNVINDDYDARSVSEAFRNRFPWAGPAGSTNWQGTLGSVLRGDVPPPALPFYNKATEDDKTPLAGAEPPASRLPAEPNAAVPAAQVPAVQQSATTSKPYVPKPDNASEQSAAEAVPAQNNAAPPRPVTPATPQPVVDEKLLQELRDAMRQGPKK